MASVTFELELAFRSELSVLLEETLGMQNQLAKEFQNYESITGQGIECTLFDMVRMWLFFWPGVTNEHKPLISRPHCISHGTCRRHYE